MSKPILRVATTHMDELLNPGTERRMDLPGFDEEFVDLPHYIIKITDRIWHERQVETIHDYYSADCSIHTLGGDVNGAAQVIQNTYDTLASFPDRRLDGDNVIWSDDGNGHFYSSHLISSKMTNLGESEFGPATGRKILAHTIADCLCHENRIVKEWLVRDYAGIVIQMGRDIDEAAAKLAEDDAAKGFDLIAHHAANRAAIYDKGALQAQKGDTPLAYASRVLADVWQAQNTDPLATHYFDRARIRYPADKELYGPDQLAPHLQDLFDAFPDMQMSVDHIADIPYLEDVRDIAVRWSFAATHSGDGVYGTASAAPVYMMAVSHWRVKDGYILDDMTIWDDVALRRQIETQRRKA